MVDQLESIDGMKTITAATRLDLDTPVINIQANAVIKSKGATLTFGSPIAATASIQPSVYAATATTNADGTGIIPAGTSFVSVTSSADTKGIKLPTPVLWNIMYVKEVGANGYYVIPEATTQFINGTEVTGAKKLACAANTGIAVFMCVIAWATGKWIQYFIDDDGSVDTGATPA